MSNQRHGFLHLLNLPVSRKLYLDCGLIFIIIAFVKSSNQKRDDATDHYNDRNNVLYRHFIYLRYLFLSFSKCGNCGGISFNSGPHNSTFSMIF